MDMSAWAERISPVYARSGVAPKDADVQGRLFLVEIHRLGRSLHLVCVVLGEVHKKNNVSRRQAVDTCFELFPLPIGSPHVLRVVL